MAGCLADSLTLFGEDVGAASPGPDRRTRPLLRAALGGWRSRRTSPRCFLTTAGSDSITVIDLPRLLRAVQTRQRALCQRSLRLRKLRGRQDSRRPQSARNFALARWQTCSMSPTAWTTTSPSSIRRPTKLYPRSISAGRRMSTHSAAGERIFFTASLRFRDSSVAPTAISTRLSTACNGTWSRMVSVRISSTTARSRTWPAQSLSNGMAAIRTCRRNAGLARRNFSSARRASRNSN